MSIGPWPTDPEATPAIRAAWHETWERWPGVASWGVFACRFVAGTDDWSQHAFHNAWDIAASAGTLDRVAAFLRSGAMRPHVAQVLWRVPDHYDHIHVSGRPMRTGTPACAGGPDGLREGVAPVPAVNVPGVGELVSDETWAPAARVGARLVERRAARIARVPEVLERILSRG